MRCPDCGDLWGEMDLMLESCQACGDPIMPDDIGNLQAELGIAEPAPPEIENPVKDIAPEETPDSVECPVCITPLMGDDLAKWESEGCPYCGLSSSTDRAHPTAPLPIPYTSSMSGGPLLPDDEFEKRVETKIPESKPSIAFFVNCGPMVGTKIELPEGKVGRDDLSAVLTDPWYEPHVGRVSGEHIYLSDNKVKDLGSTNGTWLGGKMVNDTDPTPVGFGQDLNLGGNIQLSRADFAPCVIRHNESGVKFCADGIVHLGRQDESGTKERWAEMADLQLRAMGEDPDILAYLSRRHFTVNFVPIDLITGAESPYCAVDVFEGKEKPEVDELEDGFLIRTRKNTFTIKGQR